MYRVISNTRSYHLRIYKFKLQLKSNCIQIRAYDRALFIFAICMHIQYTSLCVIVIRQYEYAFTSAAYTSMCILYNVSQKSVSCISIMMCITAYNRYTTTVLVRCMYVYTSRIVITCMSIRDIIVLFVCTVAKQVFH